MSIYEYDQEEHIRLEREDAFEDGRRAGIEAGIEEGRAEGILAFIKMARKYQVSDKEIIQQLMEEFQLEETKAREYFGNSL